MIVDPEGDKQIFLGDNLWGKSGESIREFLWQFCHIQRIYKAQTPVKKVFLTPFDYQGFQHVYIFLK